MLYSRSPNNNKKKSLKIHEKLKSVFFCVNSLFWKVKITLL